MEKNKKENWDEENQSNYNITVPMIIKIWKHYNEKDTGVINDDMYSPLPNIDRTHKIPRNKKFRKLVGKEYTDLIKKNQLTMSNLDITNPEDNIVNVDDDEDLEGDEEKQVINNVKSFLFRFRGKLISLIVNVTYSLFYLNS